MHPWIENQVQQTRRQFFGDQGLRLGGMALASMAGETLVGNSASGSMAIERVHMPLPGLPHFAPKAKAIIYVHFNGGPPQHDTWDYSDCRR